jgi:hypothetical protein
MAEENEIEVKGIFDKLTRFDPCIEREPYASHDHASMEVFNHGEWLKHSDVKEAWNKRSEGATATTRKPDSKGEKIEEALAVANEALNTVGKYEDIDDAYHCQYEMLIKIKSILKGEA